MSRLALVLVMLAGCSGDAPMRDVPAGPDAGPPPDAGVCSLDRCEQFQAFPPECHEDACSCGNRVCGNEKICQEWDDCASGTCFQCRVLFFCECR